MRQIYKDYLYDTEKSEMLYEDVPAEKVYYQTKNGRFFSVYQGKSLAIETDESIKRILGQYDVDKYIEIFGEPKEG